MPARDLDDEGRETSSLNFRSSVLPLLVMVEIFFPAGFSQRRKEKIRFFDYDVIEREQKSKPACPTHSTQKLGILTFVKSKLVVCASLAGFSGKTHTLLADYLERA